VRGRGLEKIIAPVQDFTAELTQAKALNPEVIY